MLEDFYENNSYKFEEDSWRLKCMERLHEKESAKKLLYSRQLKKRELSAAPKWPIMRRIGH